MLQEGESALRSGRLDQAAKSLKEALGAGAHKGKTLTALAKVAFERGNFDEAIDYGERAGRNGGGTRAGIIVANSYFRKNQPERAISEYRKILAAEPGNVEAQRNMAAAQRKLGK
jgi:tetratricopeptide (TPR) repeat protein